MVRITGDAAFVAKLRQIRGPEMTRAVGRALFAAGEMIQTEAQLSITRGSVSGKNHVPSRPGEPPNQDTGVLANGIETALTGPLIVEVSSNAPYSAALEYGSSKMAARPFMRPALQSHEKAARDLIAKAIDHVIKGGTIR